MPRYDKRRSNIRTHTRHLHTTTTRGFELQVYGLALPCLSTSKPREAMTCEAIGFQCIELGIPEGKLHTKA